MTHYLKLESGGRAKSPELEFGGVIGARGGTRGTDLIESVITKRSAEAMKLKIWRYGFGGDQITEGKAGKKLDRFARCNEKDIKVPWQKFSRIVVFLLLAIAQFCERWFASCPKTAAP